MSDKGDGKGLSWRRLQLCSERRDAHRRDEREKERQPPTNNYLPPFFQFPTDLTHSVYTRAAFVMLIETLQVLILACLTIGVLHMLLLYVAKRSSVRDAAESFAAEVEAEEAARARVPARHRRKRRTLRRQRPKRVRFAEDAEAEEAEEAAGAAGAVAGAAAWGCPRRRRATP